MARKQSRRKAAPAKRRAKARTKAVPPSRRKLNGELDYLGKRLDALMKTARSAEASVRAGTLEQLGALQKKQAAAKQALARLARQSAAAGGPIASGLQKAWRDIDLAVRHATRRFRETT